MSNPAVDVYRDPAVDCGGDFGEGVQRGEGAVELPPAVIGDDEAAAAVVEGQEGVFRGGDPVMGRGLVRVLLYEELELRDSRETLAGC